MKTTKRERDANRAKDERRARRQAKGRHRIDRDGLTLLPLGRAMEPELFERLYRAVRGFDPHGPVVERPAARAADAQAGPPPVSP